MRFVRDKRSGLHQDFGVISRRRLLKGAAAATVVAGCKGGSSSPDAQVVVVGDGGVTCSKIPDETAGPFPGDGTQTQNALTLPGIVRSDIRSSVGPASGVADGVALEMALTLLDASTCEPLVGYAVYVWQCDRDTAYSMYANTENYLRGVQASDATGQLTFVTIFPGCYPGRWPHIHFEVYRSLESATSGANKVMTSQFAFPKSACDAVYATSGYSTSAAHLSQLSLSTDGVFSDGASLQVATMTGAPGADFKATLPIAIRI